LNGLIFLADIILVIHTSSCCFLYWLFLERNCFAMCISSSLRCIFVCFSTSLRNEVVSLTPRVTLTGTKCSENTSLTNGWSSGSRIPRSDVRKMEP